MFPKGLDQSLGLSATIHCLFKHSLSNSKPLRAPSKTPLSYACFWIFIECVQGDVETRTKNLGAPVHSLKVLGVFVGYLYYIGMASMLGYFSPLCAESMTVVEGYVSKSPFKSAS
ncbi:hypothetical protein Csa_011622 [Cucumis sativus]|uniref:Uncharacterized protein n=1 Tax=Cucumis sativus TaxID=3659 RepID=A0A0A0L673_CUCSA|nr:hypothetical protein Csa_011622 [Cucumis sativus]